MTLTNDQQTAFDEFKDWFNSKDKFIVLSASAGRGKTFLSNHIINYVKGCNEARRALLQDDTVGMEVLVTATTHKAAEVLRGVTEEDVFTIQSSLSLKLVRSGNGSYHLEREQGAGSINNTFILIDEASQLCRTTYKNLLARTPNCKIIYVMDHNQLLAVGASHAQAYTDTTRRITLTEPVRFKAGSPIDRLSNGFKDMIKTNKFPDIVPDGVSIFHLNRTEMLEKTEEYFGKNAKDESNIIIHWTNDNVKKSIKYIRALKGYGEDPEVGEKLISNTYTKGYYAIDRFTAYVRNNQEITIKGVSSTTYKGIHGFTLSIGDKITIFQPKYRADVKTLQRELSKANRWPDFYKLKEHMADLRPSCSMTAHKAQSATYDNVFIDLNDMLKCKQTATMARLLYVACSRASKRVFFYS